ncbi:uncharacterized protein LOC114407173 [Glycine soja]|uniref:DUF4378 domain-containing protein n=1 Tax=Glycine soja TaxID=3848 RepID=A0A445LDT2_GLYSO|nr:uncharacterized protein LOC114407173 [Glycine soja]KHN18739.1 hypothetical protein glysoja_021490 [Glycine soja]RZC21461.1 hypothetical protein D0Y65_007621 [Glycine soja]
MAQKYLHELLEEDQEPFFLNKYISDRRTQMKRPSPKTSLQVKKRKSINPNTNFPRNLCKSACLFSLTDTPDLRKSPLFEFTSPVKSPCKSPNAIFLHIPSRTAALLLEAALRIQKHSSHVTSKPKTKAHSFGLFGSLYKRLTQRNQKKHEIESGGGVKISVKDVLKWDSSVGRRKVSKANGKCKEQEETVNVNVNVNTCSYNGSSALWSESNEDNKSLDMETSSSGYYSEEIHFVTNHKQYSTCFCESPFRFVLQTSSPSSGHHTPELPSPSRHPTEEKESNEGESVKKFESGEEEEEDKEQCSPVSVLDPPFEDDDEGHGNGDEEEEEEEEGGFDMECSYAIVQRAKQQLLYKLCRFEKLAELDPVELEKRMQDQEEDEDETFMEEEHGDDENNQASYKENDFIELIFQALCQSRVHDRQQIPEDFKKLVSDLIMEEERALDSLEDRDMVIRRICKRLELWKEVESNTIDMMIEDDFSREDGVWRKNIEQIRNMAGELELAIFGFLVEEFSEELVC